MVQAWGVLGTRGNDDPGVTSADTSRTVKTATIFGRDEEIGLLDRVWQSTQDENRGQVVTLSADAGFGKSTLIENLKAQARAAGLPYLTLRCSPYHKDSALYPIIEHFRGMVQWSPQDDAAVRLAKLEAMLEQYDQPLCDSVPLMASLLSLELSETDYKPLTMSPREQKQRTQDMIIGITLEAAENQSLLELWEDLHWADASTLELLELLIEQAPTAALLLVLTFRPEFSVPWQNRSFITPITLNKLDRTHAEALISRIVGGKPLPVDVIEHVVTKADGVPLFVEELTKTILASDILKDAGDRFDLNGPLSSLAIPDTLQESLMTRLDRLPKVRELAQLASVLGREFGYEMIEGLSSSVEPELIEGLEQLVGSELLYQRGRPPRASYFFKHALIQDAAYDSLLRRNREQFHLRAAKLLEARFPDIVETNPELIAHHYNEAQVADRALDYFQKAGAQSLLKSANSEAIAHLEKGLEIARAQPHDPQWERYELNALMTIAPALVATRGYASADVGPTYRRALELSQSLGDTENQFSVLLGLSMFHFLGADIRIAHELAEQALELAKAHQEPGLELAAARQLGLVLCYHGEVERSLRYLEQVVTSYDVAVHGSFAFLRGGSDFGVGAMAINGQALVTMGYPDQARDRCTNALALAYELGHPLSKAFAHWMKAITHRERGELQLAFEHAAACMALADSNGLPQYAAWITGLRGLLYFDQGDITEAIAEISKGRDDNFAIGSILWYPYWVSGLAAAYGRNNQIEQGFATIAEGLDHVARTEERFHEAELYRVKGQLLLAGEDANVSEAEACFRKAIDVAQAQKTKLWELRASTELAQMYCDQGRPNDALDLLIPIFNWFAEGIDTADIKNAKALLNKLS